LQKLNTRHISLFSDLGMGSTMDFKTSSNNTGKILKMKERINKILSFSPTNRDLNLKK
jgi:hypothetical protein